MSRNTTIALMLSCALHVAVLLSFKVTPPPVRAPEPRRVEIEFRPVVEARRGPPSVENKPRPSKRPPSVRTSAPVIVAPSVDEGVSVEVGPPGPPSDDPGEDAGGGGTEPGPSPASPPPPPDTRAEVISLPRVEYPLEAREDGVEGVVKLLVRVDARGQLISVEVRDDPGSGLGEVARRALLRAKFRAATHLGSGVESSFEYLYRFELE